MVEISLTPQDHDATPSMSSGKVFVSKDTAKNYVTLSCQHQSPDICPHQPGIVVVAFVPSPFIDWHGPLANRSRSYHRVRIKEVGDVNRW